MRCFHSLFSALLLAIPLVHATDVEIHVSPQGNDMGRGTRQSPFATLKRARQAVRIFSQDPNLTGTIRVLLHDGTYRQQQAFTLGRKDGGSATLNILWTNAEGAHPILSGARSIPLDSFRKIENQQILARLPRKSRSKVLAVKPQRFGINGFGTIPNSSSGAPGLTGVFHNDRRMQAARWPNAGDWTVVGAHQSHTGQGSGITYIGKRRKQWQSPGDAWVYGYFNNDRTAESLRLRGMDALRHQLFLHNAPQQGFGSSPKPRRYFAANVLEELDREGEYCFDTRTGELYFYPPADSSTTVEVSVLSEPLLKLQEVENLRIEGLLFEACRGPAIRLENCRRITLAGCVIRHTGKEGILATGGEKCRITNCDLYDIATSAIVLKGEKKTTGHRVKNCHIHHFSRLQQTQAPGILLDGKGFHISHNLLHDAPGSAIQIFAEDSKIEYNEIHDVCLETDQTGALESVGNARVEGNLIRYNFWHHIGRFPDFWTPAVLLWTDTSGDQFFGNVFYRTGQAPTAAKGVISCQTGNSNLFANNLFIDCRNPIDFPAQSETTSPLANTNQVRGNVSVRSGDFPSGKTAPKERNLVLEKPAKFFDPAKMDFTLSPESPVYQELKEFQPIPFGIIGLRKSPFRPAWPVEHLPSSRPSPRLPKPPKQAPPTASFKFEIEAKHGKAPRLDGSIGEGEWTENKLPLAQKSIPGSSSGKSKSTARIRWNANALFVAFDNQSEQPDSAVGLAISVAEKDTPIFHLRGIPDGNYQTFVQVGNEGRDLRHRPKEVTFRCSTIPDTTSHWICEWKIPWKFLEFKPRNGKTLFFNLAFFPGGGQKTLMLHQTGGNFVANSTSARLLLAK